ncbi:zf-HC2 domain-containing protein [Streptomyces sp. NPDC000410]|uniref:anti-sigma factor family protein n=1 Tax=Streptomyces sp. NPDC000410 TaxID=3154254 RepID=UPI00332872E1
MDLLERHRDVAAYALGVLTPADAFRFEEHLSECVLCAVRLAEFTPVASALSSFAGPGRPEARPSPRLLDRLLEGVAVRRRRGARRRLRLVAAAAALIVALPVATVVLDGPERASGAVSLRGTDWGTEVTLRLGGVPGAQTCELVVVGRDGRDYPVATWTSAGNEEPLGMEAGTALRPEEIDHLEVRTVGGERLVSFQQP